MLFAGTLIVLAGFAPFATPVASALDPECIGKTPLGENAALGWEWELHFVDGSSTCDTRVGPNQGGNDGADGVDVADFDGDCDLDIVTGWEESGQVFLYLNPLNPENDGDTICTTDPLDGIDNDGDGTIDEDGFIIGLNRAAVRQPWEAIDISGIGTDGVEDAIFGPDENGDGLIDYIVSATEIGSNETFVHTYTVVNNDPLGSIRNPALWVRQKLKGDERRFMRSAIGEIDGSECTDIVSGAKKTALNELPDEIPDPTEIDAGIWWWSCPSTWTTGDDPRDWGDREKMAGDIFWIMQMSIEDMNGDGHNDVLFNDRKKVAWMENPGPADVFDRGKWKMRFIEKGDTATGKNTPYRWHFYANTDDDPEREIVVATNYDFDRGVIGRSYDQFKSTCSNADCNPDDRWNASEIIPVDNPLIPGTMPFLGAEGSQVSKAAHAANLDGGPDQELIFTARGGEELKVFGTTVIVDGAGSGVYYLKKINGQWVVKPIAPSYPIFKYDNIQIFDYDMDGDPDIATVEENAGPGSLGLGVLWYENKIPPRPNNQFIDISEDSLPHHVWIEDIAFASNLDPAKTVVINLPAHGTVNNLNDRLDYRPSLNFNGSDAYRVRVCNIQDQCVDVDVNYMVLPVNDPPVAVNDGVPVPLDVTVGQFRDINVSANDSDVDGNADLNKASVTVLAAPAQGGVVFQGNGVQRYSPNGTAKGADSFAYTICDFGGLCDSANVFLNVINDPPALNVSTAIMNVNEFALAERTGTYSDPENQPLTLSKILGPGSLNELAGSFNWQWTAGDGPDNQTVRLRLTDGPNTVEKQFAVQVNNVPPAVGAVSRTPASSLEGQAITASADFSDVNPADGPFTCKVNYGDGQGFVAATVSGSTCTGPSHVYTDNDNYNVSVRVWDKDGDFGADSSTHPVGNVAPTLLNIGANPIASNEGASVSFIASFSDPGANDAPFSCSFDYGDGSTDTVAATGSTCAASHVFADNGAFSISVQVTDKDGGASNIETLPGYVVSNVTPTLGTPVMTPSPSLEGLAAQLSVSFVDPGVLDAPFDCQIDHGDSTGNQPGTVIGNQCTGPNHVFTDDGTFTITVTITDKDGASGMNSFDHSVENAPPQVGIPLVSPSPSLEGGAVQASAAFTDSGTDDAPFTCQVDYGDGSGNQPGSVSGMTCTGPGHIYDDNGLYTVSVFVTDKDGGTGNNTASQAVSNVAPTATFTVEPGEIFVGETALLAFSNPFDPSNADTSAGFLHAYDCLGDGNIISGKTEVSHVCTYSTSGDFIPTGSISDKDSGSTQYIGNITVLSAIGAIEQCQTRLSDLETSGDLNKGQANSLDSKLRNAIRQLERDRTGPAINLVEAYINELLALEPGVLETSVSEELIEKALRIITAIEFSYP